MPKGKPRRRAAAIFTLLSAVLILFVGVASLSQSAATAGASTAPVGLTSVKPSANLLGVWTNSDYTTGDLVHVTLAESRSGLRFHALKDCASSIDNPCVLTDLGTVPAISSSPVSFTAHVNEGATSDTFNGTLSGSTLVIKSFYHFKDPNQGSDFTITNTMRRPFKNVAWNTAARSPEHVEGAITVLNGKIYMISGSSTDCLPGHKGVPTRAVDIYDPATNRFSAGPPVITGRTQDPVAATVNGKIYLIGGTTGCGEKTVDSVEVLDPATNKWSNNTVASTPSDLNGPNFCGTVDPSPGPDFAPYITYVTSNHVGRLTVDTGKGPGTWSFFGPVVSPASFCQAVMFVRPTNHNADRVLVTGPGDGTTGPDSQRLVNFGVPVLPSAATSTTLPMVQHTAVAIGGQAILAGGVANGGTAVDLVSAGDFVAKAPTALPSPRRAAVSAVVGGRVYILGGISRASSKPAVLVGTPSS
jgi:hypothetical protein